MSKHLCKHCGKDISDQVIDYGPKLTADIVSEIKQQLREGITRKYIARKYGVSQTLISYISDGKRWSYVK